MWNFLVKKKIKKFKITPDNLIHYTTNIMEILQNGLSLMIHLAFLNSTNIIASFNWSQFFFKKLPNLRVLPRETESWFILYKHYFNCKSSNNNRQKMQNIDSIQNNQGHWYLQTKYREWTCWNALVICKIWNNRKKFNK